MTYSIFIENKTYHFNDISWSSFLERMTIHYGNSFRLECPNNIPITLFQKFFLFMEEGGIPGPWFDSICDYLLVKPLGGPKELSRK
jgi:regulatory protein YycH of two-component signal transduction system YycFG